MEVIPYPNAINLARFSRDVKKPEALYGLPGEVMFCRSCVISNQRPDSAVEFHHTKDTDKTTINFDENGICDACNFTESKKKNIDWEERDDLLRDLCDQHRKNDVESTNFSSIMEYDSGNTIFQSILEKELGSPPTTEH